MTKKERLSSIQFRVWTCRDIKVNIKYELRRDGFIGASYGRYFPFSKYFVVGRVKKAVASGFAPNKKKQDLPSSD